MRLLVGGETGLLKQVNLQPVGKKAVVTPADTVTVRCWGQQAAEQRVDRLCWVGAATGGQFATARGGGKIDLCDAESGEVVGGWLGGLNGGATRGLAAVGAGQHDWRLLSCSNDGVVRTWRYPSNTNADTEFETAETRWEVCTGKPAGDAKSVSRMRVDGSGERFVLGGREKEVQVWDIARQEAIFTARNVRDDMLKLRVPVWVADACFLNGSSDVLLVATAYRQMRGYDLRTGKRRPVYSVNVGGVKMYVGECHFTSMCQVGEHVTVLGDVIGGLTLFDLRNHQQCGVLRDGQGSVRDIIADPCRGLMACCGADRTVRAYKLSSRKPRLLSRCYLKQRQSAVLLYGEQKEQPEGADDPPTKDIRASAASRPRHNQHAKSASMPIDPLAAMEAAFLGEAPLVDNEDDGSRNETEHSARDGGEGPHELENPSGEEEEDALERLDRSVKIACDGSDEDPEEPPDAEDDVDDDGDDGMPSGVEAIEGEDGGDAAFMEWVVRAAEAPLPPLMSTHVGRLTRARLCAGASLEALRRPPSWATWCRRRRWGARSAGSTSRRKHARRGGSGLLPSL